MALLYVISALFISGLVQGASVESPEDAVYTPSEPAYLEDISPGSRIISGWPAEDGQFPYQVSLRMVRLGGAVGACGAMLIHNEWVLTAAHCLARRDTFVVRLGLTNLTRPEYIFETDISRAHIHPKYIQESTAVQTDDIGVLNLGRHVPYGANIQPIRIQSSERKTVEYGGVKLIISGYGRTDDWWLGGYIPEILSWVYQNGLTLEECFRWYPYSQVISAQTMCAGFYDDPSQNPCFGDSGGPLVMEDIDGQLTVVGINSFGPARGCNSPNPSGYVRPDYYQDWIRENTGIDFDWRVADLVNG